MFVTLVVEPQVSSPFSTGASHVTVHTLYSFHAEIVLIQMLLVIFVATKHIVLKWLSLDWRLASCHTSCT